MMLCSSEGQQWWGTAAIGEICRLVTGERVVWGTTVGESGVEYYCTGCDDKSITLEREMGGVLD